MDRTKSGIKASVFGIASNIVVAAMKMVIGLITNTISIVADGANNLGDALSSFISLFGFALSQKKADKKHPFGYQRVEYLSALIVSIIILVLGVELIINSFEKIFEPEPASDKFVLNLVILLISICVKIIQAMVNYTTGKKIKSEALMATAADSRNDVIATFGVVIGLFVSHYTSYNIDGYVGVAIGIFISISGIKFAIDSASPILGEAPDKELVKKFSDLIKSYPEVLGIHDLEIHSYGSNKMFASCHVEVDSKSNLVEIHDKIDLIEHRCLKDLGILTTLHMDPVVIGDEKTDKLKNTVKELLDKNLGFKYMIHDFRIVSGPSHTNIIFDIIVPFDVKESDEKIRQRINTMISDYDNTLFAIVDIDQDYNNVLDA